MRLRARGVCMVNPRPPFHSSQRLHHRLPTIQKIKPCQMRHHTVFLPDLARRSARSHTPTIRFGSEGRTPLRRPGVAFDTCSDETRSPRRITTFPFVIQTNYRLKTFGGDDNLPVGCWYVRVRPKLKKKLVLRWGYALSQRGINC